MLDMTLDIPTVVVRERRLDAGVAKNVAETVMLDIAGLKTQRLSLDMRQVEFMDSRGLGALVSIFESLGEGGRLELDQVRPAVVTMLRLTRMDRIFRVRAVGHS